MPSLALPAISPNNPVISFIRIDAPSSRVGYGILYQDGMVLGSDGVLGLNATNDSNLSLVTGASLLSRGARFTKIAVQDTSAAPVSAFTLWPNTDSYLIPALLVGNNIGYRMSRPFPGTNQYIATVSVSGLLNKGGFLMPRRVQGCNWG